MKVFNEENCFIADDAQFDHLLRLLSIVLFEKNKDV